MSRRVKALFRFALPLLAGVSLTAACATGGEDEAFAGPDDNVGTTPDAQGTVDAPSHSDVPFLAMDSGGLHDSGVVPDVSTAKDAPADSAHESSSGKDAMEKDSPVEVSSDAAKDVESDGPIPTTCTEADSKVGCCAGNVLYYCKTTLTSKTCTGSDVCGWDSKESYYDCVPSPGGADPSGTYPIACE